MHHLIKRGLVSLASVSLLVGGLSIANPAQAAVPINPSVNNTVKGKPGLAKGTTKAQRSSGVTTLATTYYFYNVGRQTLTAPDGSTGAYGNFRIQKPYVDSLSYHSLVELAIQSADSQQIVEVGVNVDPGLYGDSNPHIFVGSWKNGVFQGYNASNAQWVDYASNAQNVGASVLADVDVSKSMSYQVDGSGNWWATYNGAWLGYFKASNWTGLNFTKGQLHQWFGEVASTEDKPCADMGNGYLGARTDVVPARIGSIALYGTTTAASVTPATEPSTASSYYNTGVNSATTFRYGGPGWNAAGTAVGTKDAC